MWRGDRSRKESATGPLKSERACWCPSFPNFCRGVNTLCLVSNVPLCCVCSSEGRKEAGSPESLPWLEGVVAPASAASCGRKH